MRNKECYHLWAHSHCGTQKKCLKCGKIELTPCGLSSFGILDDKDTPPSTIVLER